jgi:hypothetical protein
VGAELPHDNDHLHHDHDGAHHNYDGADHYELVNDYNDLSNFDEHDDHHLPLKHCLRRIGAKMVREPRP